MFRKLLLLAYLSLLSLPSFPQFSEPAETAPPLSKALSEKIEILANRYYELGRFSGSILVVSENFKFHSFYGKANYELSKNFTSNTAFKIGELSELFNRALLQPQATLTPGNLQEVAEKMQLKNTFFDRKTNVARGYTYSYNNGNFVLEPSNNGNDFDLKSTAKDLLKVLKFLPEEQISIEGYMKDDGFSYGIFKQDEKYLVVLSNRRHPVAGEMIYGINAILEGQEPQLPLPRKEIKVNPEILQEYSGSYSLNPDMQLQVVSSNDSLFVLMGPQKVHLKPQSQNQFFMKQGDSAIRFLKDEEGSISSAELLDGFLTGNRIKKVK